MKTLCLMFSLAALLPSLVSADFLAADLVLGLPAGEVPGQGPWPGVRLEYDLPPSPWGFELQYAFRGKQYYSYDHDDNRWGGPFPWELVDAGPVSEPDWPFFQTRHVLSPGVIFRAERSWVQPRFALGVLAQIYLPAEADQYYPAYSSEFLKYRDTIKTFFGNYLKLGLEGLVFDFFTLGADFVFEIPDWGQFYTAVQTYPVLYAQSNAHFELRLGGRL